MDTTRILKTGATTLVVGEITSFLSPLTWFFVFAGIIILVDLNFGVKAAKKRGETVRFSRAWRRTIGKAADYVCWILLAGSFEIAIGKPLSIPVTSVIILLVIFGLEINSCFSNYFEYRGTKIKINIFKWIGGKTDIIEIENTENKE